MKKMKETERAAARQSKNETERETERRRQRNNETEKEGDRHTHRQMKNEKEADILSKGKDRIPRERSRKIQTKREKQRENFELYFNTDIQITEAQTVICQTDIPRKMSV